MKTAEQLRNMASELLTMASKLEGYTQDHASKGANLTIVR